MFTILLFLSAGIVLGLITRRCDYNINTESTTRWTVYFLIFFFGYSIGIDTSLLHDISAMELQALLISSFGIVGSIVFALFYEKAFANRIYVAELVSGAGLGLLHSQLLMMTTYLQYVLLRTLVFQVGKLSRSYKTYMHSKAELEEKASQSGFTNNIILDKSILEINRSWS